MPKLLYQFDVTNGRMHCLTGEVVSTTPNTDDKHPYTIVVKTELYDGSQYVEKEVQLAAWPGKKAEAYKNACRMDLKPGDLIVCVVGNIKEYIKKNGDLVLEAQVFKLAYSTCWKLYTHDDKDYSYVHGYVRKLTKSHDDVVVSARMWTEEKGWGYQDYFCHLTPKQTAAMEQLGLGKDRGYLSVIGEVTPDKKCKPKKVDFVPHEPTAKN